MIFQWSWPVLFTVTLLFICFILGEDARLVRQRRTLLQIREFLRTTRVVGGDSRAGNRWENKTGFKFMVCAWIFTLVVSLLTFGSEGNIYVSLNLTYIIAGFLLCLVTNQPKLVIVHFARLNVIHNAILLWYYDSETKLLTMRRSIILRTIATLIFFESLEETLVHLLVMSMILDTRFRTSQVAEERQLILLPLKMFFLGVLPMHTLGISEWISASVKEQDISLALRQLTKLSMSSILVPMFVIYTAFTKTSVREFSLLVGLVFVLLGALLMRFGARVDRWIAPNTLAFSKRRMKEMRIDLPRLVLAGALLLCSLFRLQTLVVALSTLAVVVVLLETRLYSHKQAVVLLLLGTVLVLGHDDLWLSSMLTFLACITSFANLVSTAAKEVIYSHMAQENAASLFIAHSLKQKFASVGSALEHIVMDKTLHTHTSSSQLLHMAILECRMGHMRCHAHNIFRKLEQGQGRAAGKRAFANLLEQIKTTALATLLIDKDRTRFDFPRELCIETDWEILHLVWAEFARRGHKLKRVSSNNMRPLGETEVCFEWDRVIHYQSSVILQRLVLELHGRLERNLLFLSAPFSREEGGGETSSSSPPSTTTVSTRFLLRGNSDGHLNEHKALAKLKLALLDDNALIRKNFERLVERNLHVPSQHVFACGETARECRAFVNRICLERVDIAIFDQNLDYEGEALIKGSDLALQAKARGFQGCLILHSSDCNLNEILDEGVFHGALEKSANAEAFIEGLEQAWMEFCKVRV